MRSKGIRRGFGRSALMPIGASRSASRTDTLMMSISWTTIKEIIRPMHMKNPPHPGRIVRDECLEALGLTVTEGARILGVTRQALNNVVNEKAGISPEM